MRNIIVVVGMIIIQMQSLSAQWKKVETGYRNNFNGVAVVNENVVYVSGELVLLKTTDRGRTWINTENTRGYGEIQFINKDTGWVAALGDSKVMYKTTDGGNNWLPTGAYERGSISGFHFLNQNVGLAAASGRNYGSSILRTTDGGESWNAVDTLGVKDLRTLILVKFYNSKIACAMGTSGLFKWTTDGGESWSETTNPYCNYQAEFEFVDSTTIITVGQSSPVVRTRDRGKTWEPLQGVGYPMGMELMRNGIGYVVGTGGVIVKTTDSGSTWVNDVYPAGITSDYNCAPPLNKCRLQRVSSFGPRNVWITGNVGGLLTLEECSLSIPSDSILGYRNVETHQVVTYALRSNPALSYKWIATGGYMLGASTNHFCDVIWGYDKNGSVCCIVSDTTCSDTVCVTTTINNKTTGGIAGGDVDVPTMSVKPNPAADMIDISTALGDKQAYFELVDVTGVALQRVQGIYARMSVSGIAPGVYHIVQRDALGNVLGMERVVIKR